MAERKPVVLVNGQLLELPSGDTLPATPPTGSAGGVLSGSFPNPGFAVDMATQGELDAVAAAVAAKLSDAPSDGKTYGRKDAAWAEVVAGGDDSKVSATGGAASGLTLNDGYTEEVFDVTGTTPALSPTNGSIQTWVLSGNSTPTAGTWASGQSVTLMVDDGSAYTINWASMSITWKTGGGTAPTLLTSGYTVIELVKIGTTIYGWLAGDA